MTPTTPDLTDTACVPDTTVSAREVFGIDRDLEVPAFSEPNELVPAIDPAHHFDPDVTLAILSGYAKNRRVLVQGLHGTGKSSHIEQVAARLNWPCMRVNLDGQISRLDLIGRDVVTLEDGKQITEFREGILPWAVRRPVALLLDEYDAGRPDIMFVIQRLLERDGRLTLLDQSTVIAQHPAFRLFATANTVGLGNVTGMYHGVQRLNHAQLDRWSIVAHLSALDPDVEASIVDARVPGLEPETIAAMVRLANLTREGFRVGDLSTLMSPRTVVTWAENIEIFGERERAFRLSFLNRCDEYEKGIVAEYYQRCFDAEIAEAAPGSLTPAGA
ncbi:AAA family ATPase [Brevibacterium otitidis]|uniref:AAA family ATPase n=1 Tax=Brevibacterium otitidis TaxID=53364 RepID=A0ABV5WY11_9MICO|nr:cobaltochelatase subunit CobS [Brevibacterium otitidis]BFF08607.1 cobaltochelatase subunit CobS [Brevibacterium otitidis]